MVVGMGVGGLVRFGDGDEGLVCEGAAEIFGWSKSMELV